MQKKLFLIDGMAMAYRAYFSMLRSPLINSKGMNTSAIFGFVNSLNKILEEEKPDYIAVAFDTDEPTFRHKIYKEYKGTRQAMPDDLVPQINKIKEIVGAYNIPMIELHGYEADDIIGTIAKRAEKENVMCYLVTPDKDFFQLVNSRVRVYRPSRSVKGSKVSDVEVIDETAVRDRFGVGPERVLDVLALMGDSVDNVPGVKGIGEKTAVLLMKEFGSLESLYENIDKVTKPKLKENLLLHRDEAFLSRDLIRINTSVELDIDFRNLLASEKNVALLENIYTELEFKTLLRKLLGSSEQSINIKPISVTQEIETERGATYRKFEDIKSYKHKYYTIKTEDELTRLVRKLEDVDELSFAANTDGPDAFKSNLIGISFSYNEGEAFHIPVSQGIRDTDRFGESVKLRGGGLPIELVLNCMKGILENKNIKKIGYNLKHDLLVLKRFGINVESIGFDNMIAAYILKPETTYQRDLLSETYLRYKCISFSDISSSGNGRSMNLASMLPDKLAEYLSEDADVNIRLYHRLEYELKKIGLEKLGSYIDFPLIEVLADMEFTGVRVEQSILERINDKLIKEEERLQKEIWADAGEEFNVNSTKQLSQVLFDKLHLTRGRKIKTGYSTDTSVLEELRHQHPIAVKLLDYRVINKLRTTYTEGLLQIINPETGRIHTSFNQTVAATGRLSSTNPNLQNIPIRTDIGRELRKAFVSSGKDNIILSADYSQIELRIMAHLAKDENMMKAFERKHDIHAETASRIFKVKMSEIDHNMRRKAKEVNFGIIYGIQAFGLASRLDIEQHEAREIIQKYFTEYPKVAEWLEKTKRFAREKGYTETLAGRRRYLPNINSKNAVVRQRDERIAINMPVQGTAADMIKIAMVNIYQEFKKEKLNSKMILQVHDELVFDCVKDEVEEVERIVANKMKHALKLSVPIEIEIGKGIDWYEAHA